MSQDYSTVHAARIGIGAGLTLTPVGGRNTYRLDVTDAVPSPEPGVVAYAIYGSLFITVDEKGVIHL